MTSELILALAGFAFVMSVSPGPSNFILLASGANYGFLKSVPIVFGISIGFLSMVLAVGLGLGPVLQAHPLVGPALRIVCAVYVVWLAIRIARSNPSFPSDTKSPDTESPDGASTNIGADRPISLLQAALLQLVNPKAWAVALIVTVSYTVPDRYLQSLMILIVVFAVVNLPSISIWALFGMGLRRFLRNPARIRLFNIAMAVLLVASMAPVLANVPMGR